MKRRKTNFDFEMKDVIVVLVVVAVVVVVVVVIDVVMRLSRNLQDN